MAKAPSEILAGRHVETDALNRFYSSYEAAVDAPPDTVFSYLFPVDLLWSTMNLAWGETISGAQLDRREYSRVVSRMLLFEIGGAAVGTGIAKGINWSLRETVEAAGRPIFAAASHLAEHVPASVQAGHRTSKYFVKLTEGVEELAVEDAFLNQLTNWTGETGKRAVFYKSAIEIEGAVVDFQSALRWSGPEMQLLSRELVDAAPVHSGWNVPHGLRFEGNAFFMEAQARIIAANPAHPLRFLLYRPPTISATLGRSVVGATGRFTLFGS